MHLGIDAPAACVAALEDPFQCACTYRPRFLGPGLLCSACFGADHGGRRALKMIAAIGRGSSNLVNAAGS